MFAAKTDTKRIEARGSRVNCSARATVPTTRICYITRSARLVYTRLKTCTVFARSIAGIVGSNHTQGMDVCIVCIYSVFVLFCV
jgi:hypothetical protein